MSAQEPPNVSKAKKDASYYDKLMKYATGIVQSLAASLAKAKYLASYTNAELKALEIECKTKYNAAVAIFNDLYAFSKTMDLLTKQEIDEQRVMRNKQFYDFYEKSSAANTAITKYHAEIGHEIKATKKHLEGQKWSSGSIIGSFAAAVGGGVLSALVPAVGIPLLIGGSVSGTGMAASNNTISGYQQELAVEGERIVSTLEDMKKTIDTMEIEVGAIKAAWKEKSNP